MRSIRLSILINSHRSSLPRYFSLSLSLNFQSSLAQYDNQDMEPMEIDCIVDIPDTPDRLTTRHGNPEKRERAFPVTDEMNKCSNYITLSPVEKSRPSQNAPLFRRVQTDKILGHGTAHSDGAEKMEKGKAVCSKFPSKSSHHGPISVLDLTKENGQSQQLKSAFSRRVSRDNATEDNKELKASTGNSPLRFIADSSNTSRNRTLAGPNLSVDRGKSIALSSDSQPQLKSEKPVSLPSHISPAPRGRGQKRLVRNGCISPHNIATRAKQSTEQGSYQANDVDASHARDLVCSNTMPMVSVEDIVAEERGCDRVKGKQVLIHPSSRGHNAGTICTASSSPVIDSEEAYGTDDHTRNSVKYSGGQGGWRTPHSDNNTEQNLFDVHGHNLRKNYVGRFSSRQNMNRMDRRDTRTTQSSKDIHGSLLDHATHGASLTIQEGDHLTTTHPPTGTPKRPRKRGSTSGNPNEASFNSEIIFVSPSGESSSSSRSPGLHHEVVDLSSEPRCTNRLSEGVDDGDNNSSEARARQVEADEILARELQEQLYHDDSFDGRGFDEHLAWELQREEDLMNTTSTDNHQISHPLWFPRANSQPRPRSHQNPSNRRRAVPQIPTSNRISRLRSRIINRSQAPAISSRGRRPRFPVDMDLNMRLDILEALEDTVGDFMDMGVSNDIFHAHHTQHDFNEDDYEMLLALDDENHRHTGASSNQINSLPQSTIQNDNFTEACAICLETPVKGEVIRHLPCLHKFHKDCIDPWLHRKTSCPVCKSSIT